MNLLHLLAAVAIGICFAAQPAINGTAARILGSPLTATALSIAITLASCLVAIPLFAGLPQPQAFAHLPWWVVFGGLIGVFVVAGSAALVPITGAAVFFVCMIAGQLIGAALVDHFGAFGIDARPVSAVKLMGIGLALAGVVLVRVG